MIPLKCNITFKSTKGISVYNKINKSRTDNSVLQPNSLGGMTTNIKTIKIVDKLKARVMSKE